MVPTTTERDYVVAFRPYTTPTPLPKKPDWSKQQWLEYFKVWSSSNLNTCHFCVTLWILASWLSLNDFRTIIRIFGWNGTSSCKTTNQLNKKCNPQIRRALKVIMLYKTSQTAHCCLGVVTIWHWESLLVNYFLPGLERNHLIQKGTGFLQLVSIQNSF